MANIVGVTSFLGRKIKDAGGDPERETMSVWATKDGKNFYTDSEGGAWRVYPFVEDTVCLQKAETSLRRGFRQVPEDAQGLPGGYAL